MTSYGFDKSRSIIHVHGPECFIVLPCHEVQGIVVEKHRNGCGNFREDAILQIVFLHATVLFECICLR